MLKNFLFVWISFLGSLASVAGQQPTLLMDINPGVNHALTDDTGPSQYNAFLNTGDRLFFVASDMETGRELWVTDGTPSGTTRITDIFPGFLDGVYQEPPVWLNGRIYFAGVDIFNAPSIYSTSGSAADIVTELIVAVPDVQIRKLVQSPQLLYFCSWNYALNTEQLWQMDGSSLGTLQVNGLNNAAGQHLQEMTPYKNGILFTVDDGQGNVWFADGSTASAQILGSIGSGEIKYLTPQGDQVYFSGCKTGAECKPYVLNSATGITTELSTLALKPRKFHFFKDYMYFEAVSEPSLAVGEFWRTDGSVAGTSRLTPPTRLWSAPGGLETERSAYFVSDDNYLYMCSGFFDASNLELKRFAGQDFTLPELIADINPGNAWSVPKELFLSEGYLYSVANDGTGRRLHITDLNTLATSAITPVSLSDPRRLQRVGSKLVFVANSPDVGRELFVMDLPSATKEQVVTSLAVYPNPASDYLAVHLPEGDRDGLFQLADLTGRIVWSGAGELLSSDAVQIHLNNAFKAGAYLLTYTTPGAVRTALVVIH